MQNERKDTVTLKNEAGGLYEITHPDNEKFPKPIFTAIVGSGRGPYLIKAFDTNSGRVRSEKIGEADSIEGLEAVFYNSTLAYAQNLAETDNYAFQDNTSEAQKAA